MNKLFLIRILIMGCVCFAASASHACPIPDIEIDPQECTGQQLLEDEVCVDQWIHFDGSGSFDDDGTNIIEDYHWTFPAAAKGVDEVSPESDCSSCGTNCLDGADCKEVKCYFETPGTYTVTLTVEDDEGITESNSVTIYVIDVDEVTSADYGCAGCNIQFDVTTLGPSGHYEPIVWKTSPAGNPDGQKGESQFTTSWTGTGTRTVTAECCSNSKGKDVTVFDIDITNLAPTPPYLPGASDPFAIPSLGQDVTVTYEISPSTFTADSAFLEVRDKDGALVHSDGSINKSGGTHTATWSVWTDSLRSVNSEKAPYEVKIKVTKGTTTCNDTTSMSVEESIIVSLVAEDSPTTGNPITDCMEGRMVTITATLRGFVSVVSPIWDIIDFRFRHTKPALPPWIGDDYSFDQVGDVEFCVDNVLSGDSDHYWDMAFWVEPQDNYTHSIISDLVWVRVYELWIDYFRDAATDEDWKVVVDKDIEYSAIASSGAKNFAWDMVEGSPDVWNPTGGNAKTGSTMKIPNSDLPDTSNDFGNTYGQVKVVCEDEEGNPHAFLSTSMSPAKRVEVFFERDALTRTGGAAPNWYYYWASDKGGPCGHRYSGTTSYAGGTISWGYASSLEGRGATTQISDTQYEVSFGPDTADALDVDFSSPRVPSVGTFDDSSGNPIFFPENNLVYSRDRSLWQGIDIVEWLVEHSKGHVFVCRRWAPGGYWRSIYGERDNTPTGNDPDDDWLPSALEDLFGTRWDVTRTFTEFYLEGTDLEVLCEELAGDPVLGSGSDWAYPGKQWHQ